MAGKNLPEGSEGLSAVELRFLKAMFENMNSKPDTDWDKVAVSTELKDAKCAKERFRQMSKRHNWVGADTSPKKADPLGPSAGGKVAKKRSPAKKKAVVTKSEEVVDITEDDVDVPIDDPVKKEEEQAVPEEEVDAAAPMKAVVDTAMQDGEI